MNRGNLTVKQLLRQCSVFAALSDVDLEKVAGMVIEKQYPAGTTIFRQGERAEDLYVLQEGKLALQITLPPEAQRQSGNRITVDAVNKNEVFGWSAVVEPHIFYMTAVCLQEAKVLAINGAKLRWLLQDNCKIGYEVLKELIKVVASRLDETRRVLVSERVLVINSE
ncbi:MAG: cyclic nucleotide-binding domain-containing protein [Dehalococcoidia bacterium]|nr:cyclic nucleotide-binding domain-containing protein [Dehalococcoidia bacterium]